MDNPLISCVVPVYNGERHIVETLQSIFAQTYRPIEVIVADDGSTDRTPEIVRSYPGEIMYCRQDNAGQAAARNLGIRSSHGEFVAFLDADDLWKAEKLTRQFEQFKARPELEYCVAHIQNFYDEDFTPAMRSPLPRHGVEPIPGYNCDNLIVRRSLFDRIGMFDESLKHADDTEWYLRARDNGVVNELMPDVLCYRRLHHANRSRNHATQSFDEYARLLKSVLDRRRAAQNDSDL